MKLKYTLPLALLTLSAPAAAQISINFEDEDYKSIIMEVMNVLSERCQDILSVTVDYNHQIDLCNSYADKV